jgi:hypothetical protein
MFSPSVNFKNFFEKIVNQFRKNVGLFFWLTFFLIIVYEFFVVSRALRPIINPDPVPETKKVQGVRYNFNDYDEAVKNIEENKKYSPKMQESKNPFLPAK